MNETCYDYSTFKAYIWFKQSVYIIFTYAVHVLYLPYSYSMKYYLNLTFYI